MLSQKFRIKILRKLAQNTNQIPSPPAFQASSAYPGIRNGFNIATVNLIDQLSNTLNIAMHYTSDGKHNLQTFKNNNFTDDASAAISVDEKNLINLCKKVYKNLFNNGNVFDNQLSAQEVSNNVDQVMFSQELQNLSTMNPAGIVAQKIHGNLKTNIINILNQIKLANPAQ